MNGEVNLYASELSRLLARLRAGLEGLDEAQLNQRPAPGANSIYVIVAHVLGNMEAWVLGIAAGQPVMRDRPAEFASRGSDAKALVARADELEQKFVQALESFTQDDFGATRTPAKLLWGAGEPRPITVREALMHTIEHAATHAGQIDVTRDLVLAEKLSTAR